MATRPPKKPSAGSPRWRPGTSDKQLFDNLLKDIVIDPGQRTTLGARLQELQVLAQAPQLKTEIRDLASALEGQYKALQSSVGTLLDDNDDAQEAYEKQRQELESKIQALEDVVKEAVPTAVEKINKDAQKKAESLAKAQKAAQREQSIAERAKAAKQKKDLTAEFDKSKKEILAVLAEHIQEIKETADDDDVNQLKLKAWLEKNFKAVSSDNTKLFEKLQGSVQRRREAGEPATVEEVLEGMIEHFGYQARGRDTQSRRHARSLAQKTISKAKASSKSKKQGLLSRMLAKESAAPKGKKSTPFDFDFEEAKFGFDDDEDSPRKAGRGHWFSRRHKSEGDWDYKERGLLRKTVDKLVGLVRGIKDLSYRSKAFGIAALTGLFAGAALMLAKPIGFAVGFLYGYLREKFSQLVTWVKDIPKHLKEGWDWVGEQLSNLGKWFGEKWDWVKKWFGEKWDATKNWFRQAINSFFHKLPSRMRPNDIVDEGSLLEGPTTAQDPGTFKPDATPTFTMAQVQKDIAGAPKAFDTRTNPASYSTQSVAPDQRFGSLSSTSTSGTLSQRVSDDFKVKSFWGDMFKKKDGNVDTDNLAPEVHSRFNAMLAEYKARGGTRDIQVNSAYRSREEQARIYAEKPGQAARPGSSVHELGRAIDIHSADANELDRMGLLDKYGFSRPVPNEPWHIQQKGIAKMLTNWGWNNADYPTTTDMSLTRSSEASNFIKQPSSVAPAAIPLRPGAPVSSQPVQQQAPGQSIMKPSGNIGAPFKGTTETIPTFSYNDPLLLMANVGVLSGR